MTIIIAIIKLKILYRWDLSKENKPNAIPLFQINIIFKYAELKISDPRLFLSR
jgi:hypothetical protein